MSEWLALAERFEAAPGPDEALERAVYKLLYADTPRGVSYVIAPITSSSDAIIGLIRERLSGCTFILDTRALQGRVRAKMFPPPIVAHSREDLMGYGKTPALALCAAFCRAIDATHESDAQP